MASTPKSSGNRNNRKVVSDKVDHLADQLTLLTSAIADLKMNQVEKPSFIKKSSLSPPTHFKMVPPTHVEKPSTDGVLDEHAVLIAELQAKNELLEDKFNTLEDKFNTLIGQITTFTGLCNKHTKDINELRDVLMDMSK